MKTSLLFITLFASLTLTFAAVQPGENLLLNGEFAGDDINPVTGQPNKAPDYWQPNGKTDGVSYINHGAPAGQGFVRFTPADPKRPGAEVHLLQRGLTLVAGETYRLSALIRTRGFESPHCGIVVYNQGWTQSCGLARPFPKDQDWTRMTRDITMVPSGQAHNVALFACNFKGVLDIADVKLEAVSPKALAESRPSIVGGELRRLRLVPWEPLLNRIPLRDGPAAPAIDFMCYGLPAAAPCDLHYAVDDRPAVVVPLQPGRVTLTFPRDARPGDFTLRLSVRNRATGEVIHRQEHVCTFVRLPEVSAEGHRRLNNLVVELLDAPLRTAAEPQSLTFSTLRDGWIFIAVQQAASPALQVMLDGQTAVISASTPRLETFRNVAHGVHTLTVTGAATGGRLVVRSIPEILNYCAGLDNLVPENKPFDWAFQKKYVLPAVTTYNDGLIRDENLKEFHDAGYQWIGSVNTTYMPADRLIETLKNHPAMNQPQFQGVTCDEQFFHSLESIVPYTAGIWRFQPPVADHVVYTWITGSPSLQGIHNDFLAACSNVCRGRGRLISEVYCRTQPTLEDARRYLNENIVERVVAWKNAYPGVIDRWGLIFGNFIQIPIISLAHHPNVDYKYYLDMQFNLLANHPACKDLGITGFWGSRNADRELHRWCFMLTRHYCVEGKTTMLSDEYGFAYDPHHLRNNDFDDGLDGWTAVGHVAPGHHAGFGTRSHNRWGGPEGIGDHFAVLTKEDAETSTVSQVARGFVPGRTYCLQFSVIDYKELKANIRNPRRFGLNVSLGDGAAVDAAQSWVHVDKRVKGRYAHNHNVPRCNLHHVVFTALKPEITVTFDNAQALKGESLALNYVMLNPYLKEE